MILRPEDMIGIVDIRSSGVLQNQTGHITARSKQVS